MTSVVLHIPSSPTRIKFLSTIGSTSTSHDLFLYQGKYHHARVLFPFFYLLFVPLGKVFILLMKLGRDANRNRSKLWCVTTRREKVEPSFTSVTYLSQITSAYFDYLQLIEASPPSPQNANEIGDCHGRVDRHIGLVAGEWRRDQGWKSVWQASWPHFLSRHRHGRSSCLPWCTVVVRGCLQNPHSIR